MAISRVQAIGNATAEHPTTAAFVSNITAGSLILVSIRASGTITAATVSDTLTNTYVLIDYQQYSGSTLLLYAAQSPSGGANTVTVSNGSSAAERIHCVEVSGLVADSVAAALDQTGKNLGASGTALALTAGLTTTQADEYLFVCGGSQGDTTFTVGADYGNLVTVLARLATEDRIVSATGTYDGTMTIGSSQAWGVIMATFKAAAAGGLSIPMAMMHNEG